MKLENIANQNLVINWNTLTNDRELVKDIQIRLCEIGLLQISDFDGIFSPVTKAALSRFCEIVFLNNISTGLFGRTFAKKLMEFPSAIKNDTPVISQSASEIPPKLETALKFTLKWEKGFVNYAEDPTKTTNIGITQKTYNSYRSNKKITLKSVEFITDSEVYEIYRDMYWKPSQAELMILPLAVVEFDTAVLFGVGSAIKLLQSVLGITADEIFGLKTEASLRNNNNIETAMKMIEQRISYHKQKAAENSSQKVFLTGWLNRANDLKKFIKNL